MSNFRTDDDYLGYRSMFIKTDKWHSNIVAPGSNLLMRDHAEASLVEGVKVLRARTREAIDKRIAEDAEKAAKKAEKSKGK